MMTVRSNRSSGISADFFDGVPAWLKENQ